MLREDKRNIRMEESLTIIFPVGSRSVPVGSPVSDPTGTENASRGGAGRSGTGSPVARPALLPETGVTVNHCLLRPRRVLLDLKKC